MSPNPTVPLISHNDPADGIAMPRRFWAILALCFSTAAIVIDGAIAAIALPTIARDLGVSAAQSVHVVTIYQLVSVVCLIPMAALGDLYGYRRIHRIGMMLLTVSIMLCFLVDALPLLLVLRFLQAVGASLSLSVSSALLREIYPVRILGRGLAINSMIVSIFTSAAPSLGGAILAYASWPMVFVSAAPLAAAGLLLSPFMPPGSQRSQTLRFSGSSAGIYAVTMILLFGAIDANVGFAPMLRTTMFLASLFIGTILVRRELASERPIIPVDLLRRPLLALSVSGAMLAFTASMAVIVILPFRLGSLYGFSTAEIGVMMSVWPLTTLIVSPIVGLLSDRVSVWHIGTAGMAIACCALILLAFLPKTASHLDITWRLSLCGGGFACYLTSNMRLVLANSPRQRAASVGGLISTARLTGQSFGAILAGTFLSLGWRERPQAFLIPATLAALVAVFSILRKSWGTPQSLREVSSTSSSQ